MSLRSILIGGIFLMSVVSSGSAARAQTPEDDRRAVAALDIAYQMAVKHNDFVTMDRILHEDFVLMLGDGRAISREALFANERQTTYQQQDEEPGSQTVRLYGDTAIVTAKLWLKGVNAHGPFDRTLWFSDTYVRTDSGWRYAFAQASLPLPPTATAAP
ncbi:nuclear transport factor 2 family protein [Brevundimonas sp. UBA7664]|uniref:nuclear transport factor 2 family protein n=1 Tax=Brevundimonas sp. UBA7664 TaxID=1946141 RepID=UPI0025BC24DB|nr:nuclear transport factor 2 family protein [Brevundimonas sp. UBA7664]